MLSMSNSFYIISLYLVIVTLQNNCKGFTLNSVKFYSSKASTQLYSSLSKPNNIVTKTKQIDLSTGINAEIMVCKPHDDKSPLSSLQMLFASKSKPPLVFIHGSFHASWCWAENFFPYFAALGYRCYALSLRGTGGTFAGKGVSRVNIMDHVGDFTSFLDYVCKEEQNKSPVVFAHSFGGLCIMKYLENYLLRGDNNDVRSGLPHSLSGVCLMCSVPPSGNGKMTLRFLKRSLRDSWKITAGLALRKVITDEELCRELFFGGKLIKEGDKIVQDWGVSNEDIQRYQGYFEQDTVATINLRDLAKRLPSSYVDENGGAFFLEGIPPALVIGARDDSIVDKEGVIETANYFGVKPTFVDSPHDVMLGSRWENSAEKIAQWLETL